MEHYNSLIDTNLLFIKLEFLIQQQTEQIENLLKEKAFDQAFLSPAALKAKYEISYTTLQRWKRNGIINVYRIPGTGKIYINEGELVSLLRAGLI